MRDKFDSDLIKIRVDLLILYQSKNVKPYTSYLLLMEADQTRIELHFKGCSSNFIDEPEVVHLSNPIFTVTIQQDSEHQIVQKIQIDQQSLKTDKVWIPKTKIKAVFKFSCVQKLSITLKQQNIILTGKTTLGNIFSKGQRIQKLSLYDTDGTIRSRMLIKGWEVHQDKSMYLVMDWKAVQLGNVGFLKKPNAYLKFYRINNNNTYSEIAKTETIEHCLTPNWKKITIPISQLFDSKIILPSFQVQCWHSDSIQEEQTLIGQARAEMIKFTSGAFDEKEVFQIQPSSASKNKSQGQLVMTQRYLQCPQTYLHHLRLMKLSLFLGINIRNQSLISKMIPTIEKLIKKIWEVIEPFSAQKKKSFIAFNIANDSHEFDQSTKEQYFESRLSQYHAEQQENIDNFKPQRNLIFQRNFQYESVEKFNRNMEQYYKKNPKNPSKAISRLLPFINKVRQLNYEMDVVFYKIVIIITDSEFIDIQDSVKEMIAESIPTSFFVLQVGNENIQAFEIFNGKSLISFDKMYESERVLSKFMKFDQQKDNIEKFVQKLLQPLPLHVLEFIDMFKRKSSCNTEEQSSQQNSQHTKNSN